MASNLVDVSWLQKHSDQVKIVDLRAAKVFQTGHIPKAINIPYTSFTRNKKGIPGFVESPSVFKNLMQQNGISNSDTVVLYSDWSFLVSMRIFWMFQFYGHESTKVLDGGIQMWTEQGLALTIEEQRAIPTQYAVEINSDVITTKFRTFMASKNSSYVIVDGRDREQYEGVSSLTDRLGHIPSAINLPWIDLINNRESSDKFDKLKIPSTLKDMQSLQKKLSVIPKDKKIILYCNGGQESSILFFALKELGVNAAIYDGSWFEWSADEKMPVQQLVNDSL